MERFNRIQDDEFDVTAKRMEKILAPTDSRCTYKDNILKMSFMAPLIKNKKHGGQTNFHLPKRALKEIWAYYDLAEYKMPKRMRIYIMIEVKKDGE